MRIRKRQVPLPFSSLSPLPLSDPLLRRTPPVQLHLQLPSSDPPNLHPYACDSAAYHTNNALVSNQIPPSLFFLHSIWDFSVFFWAARSIDEWSLKSLMGLSDFSCAGEEGSARTTRFQVTIQSPHFCSSSK